MNGTPRAESQETATTQREAQTFRPGTKEHVRRTTPAQRTSLDRVLLFYGAGVAMCILVLGIAFSVRVERQVLQQERQVQRELTERIAVFVEERTRAARVLLRNVYDDEFYLRELSTLLRAGYEAHLEFRLSAFSVADGYATRSFARFFTLYREIYPDIHQLILVSADGGRRFRYSAGGTEIVGVEAVRVKERFVSDSADQTLVPAHPARPDRRDAPRVFSVALPVVDPLGGAALGTLFVDFAVDAIEEAIAVGEQELKSRVVILGREERPVFDSAGRYDASVDVDAHPADLTVGTRITAPEARIVALIDGEAISRVSAPVRRMVVILAVVTMVLSIVLILAIRRPVLRQTNTILRHLAQIETGDLAVRVPTQRNREFDAIAGGINGMVEELRQHIQREYLLELEQKSAELEHLQAQINPHFLYNTLESIRMKALADGSEIVSEMIYMLSSLFRRMVRDDRLVVPLHEEAAFCRDYVELFRMRSGSPFTVEWRIPSELDHQGIPRLLLQPVVENCLVHGYDPLSAHNRMTVSAVIDGDLVAITVESVGRGMHEDELSNVRRRISEKVRAGHAARADGASVGLPNTAGRLSLAFGPRGTLDILANERSVTVNITLPRMDAVEMARDVQPSPG